MNVATITAGVVSTNSYVIYNTEHECIVVDPGDGTNEVMGYLEKNGLKCKFVLLTHAHFDHCNGCARFQRLGAKVYMSAEDVPLLTTSDNLAEMFGEKLESFVPDIIIKDGDKLSLLNEEIIVIATPGHTAGSVCYIINNVIFTGDTLFRLSIGRTDFPFGNFSDIISSFTKLITQDGDFIVFPGHGENTTLGYERKFNPYA